MEPRRLSVPDHIDRLRKLKSSLPGLTIDSILEPSHALVDKAVSFAEEQCFSPIPLSACTSRESEMRADKKDPVALKIEGTIRVTKTVSPPSAEQGAELHVRACVQKRVLAMQMSGIATFKILDAWTTKLFAHMMKPALSKFEATWPAAACGCRQDPLDASGPASQGRESGCRIAAPNRPRHLPASGQPGCRLLPAA